MVNKKTVLKQLAKGMAVSACARKNKCSRAYIQKLYKEAGFYRDSFGKLRLRPANLQKVYAKTRGARRLPKQKK